jgi:hypothetical protein
VVMTCSETNWLHGNAGNNRAEISYGERLLLKPLSVSPYDGEGQRQHVSAFQEVTAFNKWGCTILP